MESSQARDSTGVFRIGRQILYLWTTREALNLYIFLKVLRSSDSNSAHFNMTSSDYSVDDMRSRGVLPSCIPLVVVLQGICQG